MTDTGNKVPKGGFPQKTVLRSLEEAGNHNTVTKCHDTSAQCHNLHSDQIYNDNCSQMIAKSYNNAPNKAIINREKS